MLRNFQKEQNKEELCTLHQVCFTCFVLGENERIGGYTNLKQGIDRTDQHGSSKSIPLFHCPWNIWAVCTLALLWQSRKGHKACTSAVLSGRRIYIPKPGKTQHSALGRLSKRKSSWMQTRSWPMAFMFNSMTDGIHDQLQESIQKLSMIFTLFLTCNSLFLLFTLTKCREERTADSELTATRRMTISRCCHILY